MDLSKYQQEWVALGGVDYADKTYQYRQQVEAKDVSELAASIGANGQDIPIVCRRMQDGRVQIVCGFRRFTAIKQLGWEKIKALIVPIWDMPDPEARLLSARENMQRSQYGNLDKMFMCKKLSDQGVSNVEIGIIIGKSENQVRRYIKVAEAPSDIQEKVSSGDASISEVANGPTRRDGEQIVDNTKYNVKSNRNTLKVKMNIAISLQNEATIDAFLAEVKKTWREALKKSQKSVARREKKEAKAQSKAGKSNSEYLNFQIEQMHQAIDCTDTENSKN